MENYIIIGIIAVIVVVAVISSIKHFKGEGGLLWRVAATSRSVRSSRE